MLKAQILSLLFISSILFFPDSGTLAVDNLTHIVNFSSELSVSKNDSTAIKRNIIKDAANYFFIYIKDSWYIVTSPARINKQGTLWLGGISLVSGALYTYDDDILRAIHRNRSNPIYKFFSKTGQEIEPLGLVKIVNPYYVIGAFTGYLLKIKMLEEISIQLHETLLIGSFSRRLLVFTAGRARPRDNKGPHSFGNSTGRSFFSGHTAAAFEMATILSHHVDYWPFTVLCYGFSTTMGFQRLDTNAHWPSDVLLGAVYGIVVAKTIIYLHEKRNVTITPNLSKHHIGIGITHFFQ